MTSTTDRKQDVQKITGQANVEAVSLEVNKLLDNGLLIDLDLHGFSMLSASLTWEELGMNPDDVRRNRTSRGRKKLVPKKYDNLESIEQRLRTNLKAHTFEVTGFRPWYWLPFSAYDAWKERHDAILEELEAAKERIIAHLPEIVEENTTYFKGVARRAWASYQTPDDNAIIKTSSGRYFQGYEAFETYIVETAMGNMPNEDAIRYGIYAEYKTGYLITPPEVFESVAKAEEAQAKAAEANAKAAEASAKAAEAEARATEAEARAAEVKRAERERAQKMLGHMTGPVAEVTEQFRAQIYESVTKAAESIQKLGYVHGKTAQKLESLKALYQTLAGITGDTALEEALDGLREAMGVAGTSGKSKYNIETVQTALQTVTDLTTDAAYELKRKAEVTSRAKHLEF